MTSQSSGERPLAALPATLTAEQQLAYDEIVTGPRGVCNGPFIPLLRSPALMTHLQRAGAQLRFDSELEQRLVELIVLMVAANWNQQFEWSFHSRAAIRVGLSRTQLEALAARRRPPELDDDAAAAWELVDELQRTAQVGDAVYDRAVATLGETATVEAVVTAGYYTTLAMIMNTARTAPLGEAPVPLD